MKEQVLSKIDTLSTFIAQMKGLSNQLNSNPYAEGVNTDKIFGDIEDYLKEIRADIESIEESAPAEFEMDVAEESEKAE